jgi:glycerophosphoryl diester phosphodiesterase
METWLQRVADTVSDVQTQPVPPTDRLAACRIVSHRGEHDNRRVLENTLAAFDAAARGGVWGIEFDIQWSRDRFPMVCHDPDLRRLFGCREMVRDLTRRELERRFPLIPSLEEVVDRYGGERHLMIELKEAAGIPPADWSRVLQRTLDGLAPGREYHLISLQPDRFAALDWAPGHSLLPVGRFNLSALSRVALSRNYGGVTGHYLLLSNRMAAAHWHAGQKVGTGFPATRNHLFRELRRGVDWIFSNRAVNLQKICSHYAGGSPVRPDSSRAAARPFSSSTK